MHVRARASFVDNETYKSCGTMLILLICLFRCLSVSIAVVTITYAIRMMQQESLLDYG